MILTICCIWELKIFYNAAELCNTTPFCKDYCSCPKPNRAIDVNLVFSIPVESSSYLTPAPPPRRSGLRPQRWSLGTSDLPCLSVKISTGKSRTYTAKKLTNYCKYKQWILRLQPDGWKHFSPVSLFSAAYYCCPIFPQSLLAGNILSDSCFLSGFQSSWLPLVLIISERRFVVCVNLILMRWKSW